MAALQSIVLFCAMVTTIVMNASVLYIIHGTLIIKNVNRFFLSTLTVADLLVGMFFLPLCFLSTINDRWVAGSLLCEASTYFVLATVVGTNYLTLGISCDHYVAMKWPNQQAAVFSRVRSVCWIVVIWTTALCICVPPLISHPRSDFFPPASSCSLNWSTEQNYFITVGIIVFLPLLLGLAFTNGFTQTLRYRKLVQMYLVSNRGPDSGSGRPTFYRLNVVVANVMVLSWLPWLVLHIHEQIHTYPSATPPIVHFVCFWLAIGNCLLRPIAYMSICPDFRLGVKVIFVKMGILRFCTCQKIAVVDEPTKTISNCRDSNCDGVKFSR